MINRVFYLSNDKNVNQVWFDSSSGITTIGVRKSPVLKWKLRTNKLHKV
jgi:hypothetical protein